MTIKHAAGEECMTEQSGNGLVLSEVVATTGRHVVGEHGVLDIELHKHPDGLRTVRVLTTDGLRWLNMPYVVELVWKARKK